MLEAEIQAMLYVARHAVLADGQAHHKEIEVLERVFKTSGIVIASQPEAQTLPNLEDVFSKIQTEEMGAQALIISSEIASASGEVNEAEKTFLRKVCELNGLGGKDTEKFVKIAENIAHNKAELYALLARTLQ